MKTGILPAAALSFTAASIVIALPLYNFDVLGQPVFYMSPYELVVFVLVFQLLPALLFFGADRLIARLDSQGKWLRVYRTALFFVAALVFLRVVQNTYDIVPLTQWGSAGAVFAAGIAAILLLGFCVVAFRPLTLLFLYMAPLCVVLSIVLIHQNGLVRRDLDQAFSTATPAAPLSKGPVLILIFDELGPAAILKDGQIDRERFPNFAALSDEGVLFTNATTNHWFTNDAIPSLRTSRLKPTLRPNARSDAFFKEDFLSILSSHYYIGHYGTPVEMETGVVPGNYLEDCQIFQMSCRGIELIANRGLPRFLTTAAEELLWTAVPARLLKPLRLDATYRHDRDQLDVLLEDIRKSKSPNWLYYWHTLVSHDPWDRNPDGSYRGADHRSFTCGACPDAAQVWESYRRQTQYADRFLGEIIATLKANGQWESAVIAVTGDHGARALDGFQDGRWPDQLSVTPNVVLFMKAPGLRPGRSDVEYQHIDFAPTLFDLLQLPATSSWEGTSVFALQPTSRERVFYRHDALYLYDPATQVWRKAQQTPGLQ